MSETGGGPNIETSYSPLEEAVLQLIVTTSIYGLPGVPDSDDTSFVEQEPIDPSTIRISTPIQTAEESMTIVLSDMQEQLTVPIVSVEMPSLTHEIFGSLSSTASNSQQPLSGTKEERSRHRTPANVTEDTDATDELSLRTPTGFGRCKSRTGTPTGYLASNVNATSSYTPNRPTSRSGATSHHSEELRLIPEVLQGQVELHGMVRELIATNDRIATSNDRIATSNDRIATSIDKIATALQTMVEAMQAKK